MTGKLDAEGTKRQRIQIIRAIMTDNRYDDVDNDDRDMATLAETELPLLRWSEIYGDHTSPDDIDVKDEETKAELELLHQRARQEFDIMALGGLAVKTDSLKSLKGIGDKLEMYLYAMGIRSYAQLAKLTPEVEARFDALVGVIPGRLTRAKVVEQCQQKLQDEAAGNGE